MSDFHQEEPNPKKSNSLARIVHRSLIDSPYRLSSPKISLSPNTEARAHCHTSADSLPADMVAARRSSPLGKYEIPGVENKKTRGYIRPVGHGFDETRNTKTGETRNTRKPNWNDDDEGANPEGWPSRAGAARRPRIMMSATRITAIGEGWRAGLRIYPANDPVRDEGGGRGRRRRRKGGSIHPHAPTNPSPLATLRQQSAVRRCVSPPQPPNGPQNTPLRHGQYFFTLKAEGGQRGGCATASLDWPSVAITTRPWPRPASSVVGEGEGYLRGVCYFFLQPSSPLCFSNLLRDGSTETETTTNPLKASLLSRSSL